MKRLSIFLLIFFLGVSLFAQSSPSDKLFEKMALKDGVTMLSFSKKMLDAVNLNFDEDEKNPERNVTGDLDRVKLVIYNAPDENPYMNFRKEALDYLPKSRYDIVDPKEYDEDDDGDENVDILVLRSGRKIKECHIIIGDDDDDDDGSGLMISFFGDFKVEDLKELASKAENYR